MEANGQFWRQVSKTFRELNPGSVLDDADRPIRVALIGDHRGTLQVMEYFFAPPSLSPRKAEQVRERLFCFVAPLPPPEEARLPEMDLVICAPEARDWLPPGSRCFLFTEQDPGLLVEEVLSERWDLALPLAKNFVRLRRPIQQRWIRSIAIESALFAMMTALSGRTRTPLPLTRSVGGFASGSVFVTANQLRLAFLMAAANDSDVGFREQAGQISAIILAALGWRSLAREAAAKASGGGSVLAKGLFAFAGTYTAGLALEQFHLLGRWMTRKEKREAFQEAYYVGRRLLEGILGKAASPSGAEA